MFLLKERNKELNWFQQQSRTSIQSISYTVITWISKVLLKVFNNTARYVDQGGGKRSGSFAMYLEFVLE